MKTALTNREKALLFIAAIVGVVFLAFNFLIMPTYDLYTGMLDEYDALTAEKMLLEIKLQNEESTRTGHDNAENAYNEAVRPYPAVMPNEEVDRILTGICLKNNLAPVMLGLSDAKAFGTDEKNGSSNPEDGEAQNPPVFVVVTANMVLIGDYDSLKNLINTVDSMSYIRISRVSYSNNLKEDEPAQSNISVFFEVTMLNDTQQT